MDIIQCLCCHSPKLPIGEKKNIFWQKKLRYRENICERFQNSVFSRTSNAYPHGQSIFVSRLSYKLKNTLPCIKLLLILNPV